jgi:hypothetical protein
MNPRKFYELPTEGEAGVSGIGPYCPKGKDFIDLCDGLVRWEGKKN